MSRIESHQLRLRDGRLLGYALLGPARGRVLLYFHGAPSSRLEALVLQGAAESLGLRIVAVDRPGYGLSDPKPGRRVAEWPEDIRALADALELERFALVGASGGGPYAAACAWAMPERLSVVGLVCALGPMDTPGLADGMLFSTRMLFGFAQYTPALLPLLGQAVAGGITFNARVFLRLVTAGLPAVDRKAVARAEVQDVLARAIRESVRQGAKGGVSDLRAFVAPWGFEPRDIHVPVQLWHGERDRVVPPAMGRHLAAAIPDCQAHFLPDEGHYSLPITRADEILRTLLE